MAAIPPRTTPASFSTPVSQSSGQGADTCFVRFHENPEPLYIDIKKVVGGEKASVEELHVVVFGRLGHVS
jgi:hypothetical protein